MRSFLRYYKWHLIFLLLIIICIGFMLINITTSIQPDLIIGYTGINYINVQTFNDNKAELELLLRDANEDGDRVTEIYAYALDLESDVEESLLEMVEDGSYDIYITTKEALENFDDKSAFEDVEEYLTLSNDDYKTLKDKSGRAYATSIEENDYVKELGILDATDLYIAVARDDLEEGEELAATRKNGRNIAGYILGEQ